MDNIIAALTEEQWTHEEYSLVNTVGVSCSICAKCFTSKHKWKQRISAKNTFHSVTMCQPQSSKKAIFLHLLDEEIIQKVLKKLNKSAKIVLNLRKRTQKWDTVHEEDIFLWLAAILLSGLFGFTMNPTKKEIDSSIELCLGLLPIRLMEDMFSLFFKVEEKNIGSLFTEINALQERLAINFSSNYSPTQVLCIKKYKVNLESPKLGNDLRIALLLDGDTSEEGLSLESGRTVSQDGEVKHRTDQGVTGLFNLGNSCYMNAVLQCLCSTTPLVEYFLCEELDTSLAGEEHEIVDTFAELMDEMWFGEPTTISAEAFWFAISKVHPAFGRQSQQDAQELLIYTLNTLHEDLIHTMKRKVYGVKESSSNSLVNSASESSIITHLLQGVLRYDTICLECGYTSHKNEICTVISLPLPPGTQHSLQECLECFFQQVMLTWTDQIFCPVCQTKQDTSVKVQICKPPKIIIFHLKRFEYEGQLKRKLKTNITFPLKNLDLSPFLSPFNMKHPKYNLYAVVNHFGELDHGHYTAYCKHAGTEQWIAFDDTRCFKLAEAMVQTSSAYILFYTSEPFSTPRRTSHTYAK